MFKKSLMLFGAACYLNRKTKCSPQPPLSMILRGEYQNKIRRYSPPEKIFDVFATEYEGGRLYMTIKDLLKAICFYNYSLSDEAQVQGFVPPQITKFLGKTQKFEIYDYFILARFFAYSREKMTEYFQKNNLFEMNEKQFKQLLLKEVCSDYLDHIKSSIIIEPRQFKPNYDMFVKKVEDIAKSVYDNRQNSMTLKDLFKFRRAMVGEVCQFEYLMFPVHEDGIDGSDFARSIVKYVQPGKSKKYMSRISRMKELQKVRISLQSYKSFHIYLWVNIHALESILNQKGAISSRQFADHIDTFVNKKGSVSPEQIQVAIKILDYDNSGFLQKKQVLGVLKNLSYYTTVKSGELTFLESAKKDLEVIWGKIMKIQEILQE